MNNSQILLAIFGCICSAFFAFVGFLLKNLVNDIKTQMDKFIEATNSGMDKLNERLERFEEKLGDLVTTVSVNVVKQDSNAIELEKLKLKVHDIIREVQIVKLIQERCDHCNKTKQKA